MPLTKPQLIAQSLQRIGVLAANEEVSSADAQLVGRLVDQSFADLENIITFMSAETPDWAADAMTAFVGAAAAPYFGRALGYTKEDARTAVIAARDRRLGLGDEPEVVQY